MSDSKKRLTESVSALVDGEVSELELHRILKELELEGLGSGRFNAELLKTNGQDTIVTPRLWLTHRWRAKIFLSPYRLL